MTVIPTRQAVTHTAPVLLAHNPGGAAQTDESTQNFILKNLTGTATIYVGDANVTDADGWPWAAADGPFVLTLEPGESLYGILATAAADQNTATLGQGR